MPAWSSSLLDVLDECLDGHEVWKSRVHADKNGVTAPRGIHLAVFVEPFLGFLLGGQKTVESRFSIHRCPPFGYVHAHDLVLIKESGGPIVAIAEVSDVWYYTLNPGARDFIRARFAKQLCVEAEFWERKADSCYATLMQFSRVAQVQPIHCTKRDRRGWVVLASAGKQGALFSAYDKPQRLQNLLEGTPTPSNFR
jgi:hypothetical protein